MYSVFEKLCKENGVKPTAVGRATGIASATLTSWKKGEYTPKADKLQKIADYFGVSLAYLLTGETEVWQSADNYDVLMEENPYLRHLVETVRTASPETLTRLRYYAEGLMAAGKDKT